MPDQDTPIKNGDILEYAREDSGILIDSEDIIIGPGDLLVVGDDVNEELGQVLVDRGYCRRQVPTPEEANQEEAPKAPEAPSAEVAPASPSPPKQAQEEPENTDKPTLDAPPSETKTPSAEAAA